METWARRGEQASLGQHNGSSPTPQETSILPKLLKCLKPALTLGQNTALAFHSTNKHVKMELAFPMLDLKIRLLKHFSWNTLKHIRFFNPVKPRMIKL